MRSLILYICYNKLDALNVFVRQKCTAFVIVSLLREGVKDLKEASEKQNSH